MGFVTEHISEPYLMFNGGRSKDPKAGLIKYGPRTPSGEEIHIVIKAGIIGSSETISATHKLLKDMRNTILHSGVEPKRHLTPFPGLGKESPLNITINTQKRWRVSFSFGEIEEIKKTKKKNNRIEKSLELIEHKIQLLYEKESPPDIVIISIPQEITNVCSSPFEKKPKIQTNESDFHNRIKLQGMKIGLPTQLIRPETLRGEGTQDKSVIAWNLAVGILYKSQKGHPWKLSELENGTCFAGISFYKERGNENNITKASMAQVFLETGESFILRGGRISGLSKGKQTHLNAKDSEKIVNKILHHYKRIKGGYPDRLVIHKTSNFWEEEREGIKKAAKEIEKIDLITILDHHPLRMFSTGDFPVLRGTLVSAPDGSEHYLYTMGYTPAIGTYPGPRIPKPIVIRPDRQLCYTSIQEICKEILSFTKLDWNTAQYCRKLPVTIEVARSVGGILAEAQAKKIDIDPHYYFYM